jgi:hypothetical protein
MTPTEAYRAQAAVLYAQLFDEPGTELARERDIDIIAQALEEAYHQGVTDEYARSFDPLGH